MDIKENFLESCLFFNVNTLSRHLLKIAQDEFKPIGISPAHASLLLLVYDNPGISPKQLSSYLHLTPSTITRFIDALVKKDLVIREAHGKLAFIHSSAKGETLKPQIALAYKRMHDQFSTILGENKANNLSYSLLKINQTFSNNS